MYQYVTGSTAMSKLKCFSDVFIMTTVTVLRIIQLKKKTKKQKCELMNWKDLKENFQIFVFEVEFSFKWLMT